MYSNLTGYSSIKIEVALTNRLTNFGWEDRTSRIGASIQKEGGGCHSARIKLPSYKIQMYEYRRKVFGG